jgi:hypothetical protein
MRRRFLCEFPIGFYVKLSSAVRAILVEGPKSRTHYWKRTIHWLFHQNWVLIEQMVSHKRFLWEFPIGSYVKLSSAVAAILVRGLKWRTHFWKRTTQRSFQQSLVAIDPVVYEEKIFMWISHRVLCKAKFGCESHFGRRAEEPDTLLEKNHPLTISPKLSSYWANGFTQEDFYGNFP